MPDSRRDTPSPPLIAALVVLTLVTPMAGCRTSCPKLFALPAAHTTAEHEGYYHRKVAEVDACTTVDCNVAQPQLAGEGPVVRERLPEERLAEDELWHVTLHTAVRTALQNNKVIRQDTQFTNPANPILTNVDFTSSVFDPAIQDTNILFGNRGVAAAHADFNPQLTGNLLFGRNDQVVNVGTPTDASDRTAGGQVRLEKQLHFGGTLGIQHDVNSTDSNSPVQGLDSQYTGSIVADFSMPLLAGAGTEFTQIAGPAAFISPRVTSVNQGILIARISSELARVDLEQNVRGLVNDVVSLYWDLSLAHSRARTEQQAVEDAERLLNKSRALFDTGRATAAEEAQSAAAYFGAQSRAEEALRVLDETERRMRRLLGLDVHDGRLLVPADEPQLIELPRMWNPLLSDALVRRPQLRRSKHNIRSLQLQLRAARNLNRPTLNLISSYRTNGFGEELADDTTVPSFYNRLTDGTLTGWTAGLQFSMPLGFQLQRSLVDNLELRISKSMVQLAEAETEIAHELAAAYQNAERWSRIADVNRQSLDAATRLVRSLDAQFEVNRGDIDQLVRAQQTQAQARIEFERSVTEFEKSLASLDFRRSALLERCDVHLDFPHLPVNEDLDRRPHPLHALCDPHLPPRLPSRDVSSDPRLGELAEPVEAYDPSATLPEVDEESLGRPREAEADSVYDDGLEPLDVGPLNRDGNRPPSPAPAPAEDDPSGADPGRLEDIQPAEPAPDSANPFDALPPDPEPAPTEQPSPNDLTDVWQQAPVPIPPDTGGLPPPAPFAAPDLSLPDFSVQTSSDRIVPPSTSTPQSVSSGPKASVPTRPAPAIRSTPQQTPATGNPFADWTGGDR